MRRLAFTPLDTLVWLACAAGACTPPKQNADPILPVPEAPAPGPSCAGSPACATQTEQATSCCETLWLPPGEYLMGFDPNELAFASELEPQDEDHPVRISGVFLDRFEITWSRYRRYLASGAPIPAAGAGALPALPPAAGGRSGMRSCRRQPLWRRWTTMPRRRTTSRRRV